MSQLPSAFVSGTGSNVPFVPRVETVVEDDDDRSVGSEKSDNVSSKCSITVNDDVSTASSACSNCARHGIEHLPPVLHRIEIHDMDIEHQDPHGTFDSYFTDSGYVDHHLNYLATSEDMDDNVHLNVLEETTRHVIFDLNDDEASDSESVTGSPSTLRTVQRHSIDREELFHVRMTLRSIGQIGPPSLNGHFLSPQTATVDELLAIAHDSTDRASRSLNALTIQIRATGMDVKDFFQYVNRMGLNRHEDDTNDVIRGHIDGGSQGGTTDRLDLMWHVKLLPKNHQIKLNVADDFSHRPKAVGYLRVPVSKSVDGLGYVLARVYWTPSLPVTIISPDALCREHDCRGYTAVSMRNGSGQVELHHCKRLRQSVTIPASVLGGLLYSEPLIKPETSEEVLAGKPRPQLHVREVTAAEASAVPAPGSSVPSPSSFPSCFACTPDLAVPSCGCPLDSCSPASLLEPEPVPPAPDPDSMPDSSAPPAPADYVGMPTFDPLAEKLLHFQRLGYQPDVSIDQLREAADGVPHWPVDSPHLCPGSTDASFDSPDSPSVSSPLTTASVSSPSLSVAAQLFAPDDRQYVIRHLTRDQQRILWHTRLAHMHARRISDLHRSVDGVPKVPLATELDTCPVCASAKLRKANRTSTNTRVATVVNQGISIDFGFIVQKSSNQARFDRLQGLHGETCYCLIVDHKSGTLYGETFRSKAPPIDFLNRWLTRHGCGKDVSDKYVRFDLGGDLGKCDEVVELFEDAGYSVEPTAPMASSSNGPGERPHQTIGDAIRAMIAGSGIQTKFWPYAFHHFLRLYNVTPHGDNDKSPYEIVTSRRPNLRLLRTFGCRVYALPARPRRPEKVTSDARTGIFLGYSKTMRNVLYWDLESEQVKTAQHVAFDESMADLVDKPPNARYLDGIRRGKCDLFDAAVDLPDLEVTRDPFNEFREVDLPYDAAAEYPLGLVFRKCDRLHRAYVSEVNHAPAGRRVRTFAKSVLGAYVVSIAGRPVFTLDSIDRIVADLHKSPPASVPVVFAPERRSDSDSRSAPAHLRLSDLRRVCALQHAFESGEDDSSVAMPSDAFQSRLQSYESDMSNVEMTEMIQRLVNADMTPEEQRLKRFTRRNLMRLPNWPEWDAQFDAQLEQHYKDKTIGDPVPRPKLSIDGRQPNILRIQWSNLVKPGGKRKCRACIDGSRRSAPWLRDFGKTYASCISQPCMRLFFALCAVEGLIITIGDTINAFQQSPPPTEQCYLAIDDAYASWYLKKFGKPIDPKTHVVPVLHALQGHPEAGALFEKMIVGILVDELKFKSTTHEPNLYRGKIDGHDVLVCRQVDDFAIGTRDPAVAEKFIGMINERVTTLSDGVGKRYNGIDLMQTRDYIKVHCQNYIERVLQTHGWEAAGPKESDRHDSLPITSDVVTRLQNLDGPLEGSVEHKSIEAAMKFSYRQVLGELIYAYIVARMDIGYAVTFLSRFAQNPHQEHYTALKNVCRYLRRTKDWGLVYWRPEPVKALPHVPLSQPGPLDASLPEFPKSQLGELVGYVDAAHATDIKTRRSVTGIVFCLAGGAIAYKSKLQPTCATSSTEAEFIAAVHAAKIAKYLRSVLTELGYPPSGPTPLYEDNQAAIAMINENKPTARSRHIDVQWFAIQEWRQRSEVVMRYIPTTINVADAGTKALGWTLHSRHCRRAMGHYGRPDC